MPKLRTLWRGFPAALCALVPLLVLAACDGANYPQSSLHPLGDVSKEIDDVFQYTVWLSVVVFVLVEGALLYVIYRYRGKEGDPEPVQSHGNATLEVIWTVIPVLIIATIAVPTVKTIFNTSKVPTSSPDGQPPLKIEVIGHQWWWEFRYPDLGITTAGEWHIPINRTVDLRMTTVDVLHSFWVPQFVGKRDVFPNRETRLAFTALKTGDFPGACAEFCGTQHGRMDHYLMVDEPADFDAWVARRRADSLSVSMSAPPDSVTALMDPVTLAGETLFRSKGCIGCHSLSATNPFKGLPGPNLSGIGSRKMIASGWLENTDEHLAKWIQDPQQYKHGVIMRNNPKSDPVITDDEAAALAAYLRTKR